MRKKDYELIANAVARFNQWATDGYEQLDPELATNAIAEFLELELQHDNPRFDRDKFLTACGIEQD